MIHEADLDEAIAVCQGERNPNANTCAKLASYYILKDYMYREKPRESYSRASGVIEYDEDSELSRLINGRDVNEVMPYIEELLDTIRVLLPRVYSGFMRKIDF